MKGPSNIESCLLTQGYNRQNLSRKDFNTVKNPDLFITLLADKIKNIKDPVELNSATLPLTKNYLRVGKCFQLLAELRIRAQILQFLGVAGSSPAPCGRDRG